MNGVITEFAIEVNFIECEVDQSDFLIPQFTIDQYYEYEIGRIEPFYVPDFK